jgi:SAM-dependent methyltransferase
MFSGGEAYERFMGRWSQRLAEAFVEFAGVQDGDRILDVGVGTGSLTRAILARFPSAVVVGIDPSPDLLGFARARIGAAEAARATVEQGDAQRLRFADAAFDRALALLAVNFIPDRDAALREMMRVTRPGGAVAAAVWDYGDRMEMLRVFWDEAVALDPAAAARDERHMPLCRAGELAAFWRAHGLAEVREEPLVVALTFETFDDFWLPFFAGQGPAGAYAAALPADRRARLEQRVRRRLLGDADGGPIKLAARAWAVRGVVPAR